MISPDTDESLSDEDRRLFQEACGDVRRLVTELRVSSEVAKPAPDPVQTRIDEQAVLEESLDLHLDFDGLEEDDSYLRAGVQKSVLRKLKKGQYCVNVAIDLHGMTARLAAQAVTEFCNEAHRKGAQCLRIIHGKGWRSGNRGPVLKPLVRRLLVRRDDVLAFCPARASDGGSGALYVLLKCA